MTHFLKWVIQKITHWYFYGDKLEESYFDLEPTLNTVKRYHFCDKGKNCTLQRSFFNFLPRSIGVIFISLL